MWWMPFFHNNFFHNVADIYMGFCVIVCGFRIYCKHVHIAKGLFQAQFPLNVKSYFISTCINVLFDFLTLIKCWVLWALIEYQAWSAWARTIWCIDQVWLASYSGSERREVPKEWKEDCLTKERSVEWMRLLSMIPLPVSKWPLSCLLQDSLKLSRLHRLACNVCMCHHFNTY